MPNRVLRASWIATALAAVLAVGAPVLTAVKASGDDAVSRGSSQPVAQASTDRGRGPRHRPANPAPKPPHVPKPSRSRTAAARHLLVRIPSAMAVHRWPRASSPVIGTLPSSSKYYHVALTAWIDRVARHGRWGRVEVPYMWPRKEGWVPLRGLRRSSTHVEVHVDLSEHRVTVTKFSHVLHGYRAATGAPASPTPPGEYFVTDRIPFYAGSALGTFAFGISGIQPHLPAGWSGGNQLAIHGTNDPSSIGRSASAGCVRVSERALRQLKPLLRLGTPVTIAR